MLKLIILAGGITRISHGAKINNSHPPIISPNFPIINKHYPTKFQGPHFEKNSTDFEKILTSFMQNTGQAISSLEVQMSQLAGSLSERPKGTLPSQPVANSKNSSQAHLAQEDHMNQCNLIHTLRSGKQVDNQVSTPSSSTSIHLS